MNKRCRFIEPKGEFKGTERLKFRIFEKILDLIKLGVSDFAFVEGHFNDLCYEAVSKIKAIEYFYIKRIRLATFNDLVCEPHEVEHLENLFFNKANLSLNFTPYECIVYNAKNIEDILVDCDYSVCYNDVY